MNTIDELEGDHQLKVALRRLLFLAALLSMSSVSTASFDYGYNRSRPPGGQSPVPLIIFGTFMWGANSLEAVLAAWLAGRKGTWQTRSGWLRIAAYIAAYTYGTMLHSATQDWLHSRVEHQTRFRWPGLLWDDYSRPAIDLLSVLVLTWLSFPVFALFRGRLATKFQASEDRQGISLAFLFGWTAMAAVILLWIRFLTWEGVAPSTAYDSMSPTHMLTSYLTKNLPGEAVVCVATMLMVVAWPRRWWVPMAALAIALLIDSYGHRAIYWMIDYSGNNVLAGPAVKRWSYIARRNSTVWIAFGVAYLLGVSFQRMRRQGV